MYENALLLRGGAMVDGFALLTVLTLCGGGYFGFWRVTVESMKGLATCFQTSGLNCGWWSGTLHCLVDLLRGWRGKVDLDRGISQGVRNRNVAVLLLTAVKVPATYTKLLQDDMWHIEALTGI